MVALGQLLQRRLVGDPSPGQVCPGTVRSLPGGLGADQVVVGGREPSQITVAGNNPTNQVRGQQATHGADRYEVLTHGVLPVTGRYR